MFRRLDKNNIKVYIIASTQADHGTEDLRLVPEIRAATRKKGGAMALVYIYLSSEVKKKDGFFLKQRKSNNQGNTEEWTEYGLPGIKILQDKGRWYLYLNELTEPVPAQVADIVEEVSFREWITFPADRESGIYVHESAEAEIEGGKVDSRNMFVRLHGKTREDVLALFRMIRAGSLRPHISYECPQGGVSRGDLQKKVEQLTEENKSLKISQETAFKELKEKGKKLFDRETRILNLVSQLKKAKWPFCLKKTWARKLIIMLELSN